MLTHRHLTMHLYRLTPRQAWNPPREGLFFLFFLAGVGESFCHSSTPAAVQPLARGDVMILQAGDNARVRAAEAAELAFCAFSVRLEHLFPLFMADQLSLIQTLMDSFQTARFYPATNSATVGWHQLIRGLTPEFNLEHRSQLLHVTGAILSEEFRKLQPPLSRYERANARLTRVFEQLDAEEILNLSGQELAGRFGCSQRHLNRIFKEHFGLSLGALRMEMRLLKVVSLLRNTETKIITLAGECGFNHRGLFNACFKRRFGVSPGQWRKNVESHAPSVPALVTAKLRCQLRENGLCPWLDTVGKQPSEVGDPKLETRGQLSRVQAVGSRPFVDSDQPVSRA